MTAPDGIRYTLPGHLAFQDLRVDSLFAVVMAPEDLHTSESAVWKKISPTHAVRMGLDLVIIEPASNANALETQGEVIKMPSDTPVIRLMTE